MDGEGAAPDYLSFKRQNPNSYTAPGSSVTGLCASAWPYLYFLEAKVKNFWFNKPTPSRSDERRAVIIWAGNSSRQARARVVSNIVFVRRQNEPRKGRKDNIDDSTVRGI